ncbi:peptide ABC transporter substrate-binding protein, partial [Pseudooceanicola lipolyticus]
MTRIDRRALFASGAAAALLAASGLSANAAPRLGGTL